MKSPTSTLLFFACLFSSAQSISVSNLAIDNVGKVSFDYSVSQHHSARESYKLQVFSSADQFLEPLRLDLASAAAGETKNISFNGPQLIGSHNGNLQFKFKAEATVFPVRITTTAKKFKSGKNITITWTDFHESGWYDVELYSQGNLNQTLVSNHRGTSCSTNLPKKMEKGTYEIRVTPTKEKNLYSEDYPVTITAGNAKVFMIAGGALAGAGILVLGGSGGGDDGGTDSGTPLPDPPTPGNN